VTEYKFGLGANPSQMIEFTVGTSTELPSSATNFAYLTTYYWYVK